MRQLLSAADGAWWRMERPTNPMTITAVFTFAEPLPYARLAALVTGQLLEHARFRQRVVDTGAGQPYWSDVPDLDVADHVIRVELPGDGLGPEIPRRTRDALPRSIIDRAAAERARPRPARYERHLHALPECAPRRRDPGDPRADHDR